MAKKGNVRRISDKKKNRPKIRFNIWMLIIIFALSFAGCFVLYMAAANMDEDFFDDEFSGVDIIENSGASEQLESSVPDDAEDTTSGGNSSAQTVISNPVPSSAAVDISYIESCCLVTDSTLLAMKNHGFSDVIGSDALNAVSINTTKVESSYGTVTAYETLKIKKPINVYIMLGSDIGVSSTDDMISNYMTFINNLKSSIPETKIYIMQLPPVFADEDKNAVINDYNTRLLSLADTLGVYCIDTNTEFKANDGNLREEYISTDSDNYNFSYTEKYYTDICGYILTHTA